MRIAILTLPPRVNYGGILQAYALQTTLERMGHSAEVLDTDTAFWRVPRWRRPLTIAQRVAKKMLGRDVQIFRERILMQEYPTISREVHPFIEKHIRLRHLNDIEELGRCGFDAVVVGSDQVLRPKYFRDSWRRDISMAYLDRLPDVRKVAYAPSFGTDKWEYSALQTAKCRRGAAGFKSFSVREKSGIDLCAQHLGVDAVQVADPTLLLDKSDYCRLIEEAGTAPSPGNMCCYVLDSNAQTDEAIARIAAERGLTPFRTNVSVYGRHTPASERVQPPVEQWLRGFMDAELVVTDSFHACVFAIIFGKPFMCLGNQKRGMARFNSLLDMFGIKDSTSTIGVEEKLREWRGSSIDFLKSSLK